MYVNKRLQDSLRVPIQGWFAQRDQFAMGQGFDRAEGMRGFQIASPSIVGMRCVEAAFSMIAEATLPAIAAKAALGTDLMVRLHDAWLAPLGFSLTTPRDPLRRGGHVTLRHRQTDCDGDARDGESDPRLSRTIEHSTGDVTARNEFHRGLSGFRTHSHAR
jgi:kynureninase